MPKAKKPPVMPKAKNGRRGAAASRHTWIPTGKFPLMDLPLELREDIMRQTMPHTVRFRRFYPDGPLGKIESLLALAQQGNSQLRLECTLMMMQHAVLHTDTAQEAANLRAWLASIDFAPLQLGNLSPLKNGFGAVCRLAFSDHRRVRLRDAKHCTSIADDLELVRMCTGLRFLEIEMCLTRVFPELLGEGFHISEAMRCAGFDTYQIADLLEIKGLEVLSLRLNNTIWIPFSEVLSRDNLTRHVTDQYNTLSSWLVEEFRKRGQTVRVEVW